MDKFEKGTILYDLQPYCNALLPVMRTEKDKTGKTYQQISDTTGITMDNIKRFYTGEHKQPSVYKIAALCKYFNLSMDALFGFLPTAKTVARTELDEKDAEIEALKEQNKNIKAEMASRIEDYERRMSAQQSHLADVKADKVALTASLKEKNKLMAEKEAEYKASLGEMKAEYKNAIIAKNRVIKILNIIIGILTAGIIALLLFL
jgi:transcriptional regulator with XRE-family HTH domain